MKMTHYPDDANSWVLLLVYDGSYAAGFQQGDDAVLAIPDAVARAPDFVGFDLSAAGQHDDGFGAASGTDAWSTG